MTDQAPELLPYPFCGGEAELRESKNCHDTWLVRCTQCQIKTTTAYHKSEPISEWNTRPTPAERPVPQVREALALAIKHIEHMAAFITEANSDYHCGTYSFESLGEDMPGIRDALTARPSDAAVAWTGPSSLQGMIAAIYEGLDDEDRAWVDTQWAEWRGIALPPDEPARVIDKGK